MVKQKVLIADDELVVRKVICQILSKDYEVIEAQNGEEAVNIARSQKPDVVLMDIMMPGMDGLTACHKIKSDQTTGEIPVVMVTAVGFELNQRFSKDVLGADGYITKPFDSQELLRTVRQLSPSSK